MLPRREVRAMGLLEGRRAVVTGGAAGIGRATCRRLAAEGARVAVFDVDEKAARDAAAEVGGKAFRVDVADANDVEVAMRAAAEALGGLDLLVNNAGAGGLASLHRTEPEAFRRLLDVNLAGVFHGIRAAVPLLQEAGGGAIVNNASATGVRPTPGESAYAAAKAAVLSLTRSAALEYGPTIRVNAVSPGVIRTPLTESLLKVPGALAAVRDATPLARVGDAEEVAGAIVFLASDLASFVTGQNLVVDGGLTLPQAGIDPVLRGLLARMEGHRSGPQ